MVKETDKLYIMCRSYTPNSAGLNRLMSIIKSLSKMRLKTEVVFFSPDSKFSKAETNLPFVEYEYLWDHFYIKHSKLKYLSFLFYILNKVFSIPRKSRVLIFGFSELLPFMLKRKDCDIFYEISENPEISLTTNKYFASTLKSFLKNCKKLKGLFVISNALKEYFVEKGVEEKKVHVINMTVDKTRFEGIQKTKCEEYIAYCGNVSNNKDGVDKLIKSFSIVVKRYPELKLYIIGQIPSNEDPSGNIQLIKDLGVEDNVVFTGRKTAEEMPQLLKNARVLTLARPGNKQAKYGFPTKLGEYLMTENPVVITSVGDIPLFLKDGFSALIASPNNNEEFAEKVIWAMDHPDESQIIGKQGKVVALNEFNAEIETKKIVDVIFIK